MVLLALSGCVHRPPLTGAEWCGAQGMVLVGEMSSSTNDRAVAIGRNGTVYASGESSSLVFNCRRVETKRDECEVRAASESIPIKEAWWEGGRNALIFVGACAFILPGIAFSVWFHSQEDDVDFEAEHASFETYSSCMAEKKGS